MAFDAKQLPLSGKGELPFAGPPPSYTTAEFSQNAPRRPRLSSALVTLLKLSIPSIYLVSLLSRTSLPALPNLLRTQTAGINYPSTSPLSPDYDDPASEFKDDVFPLRPHEPWDISTDYPHPRTLEYDVEEGTWLRLDVHPVSGDIVFDMAGDIYCLPASSYSEASLLSGAKTQAIPVLTGVPHDSEPSFSPEGDRLAFKSDAGIGIDNIWVMPWAAGGCAAMDVRSPSAMTAETIALKQHEARLLAQGVKETEERRMRRLSLEGRLAAVRVTNETYNWVSDPRWHSSGDKIIATKRYFSTRSLGAGEGWEFTVPSLTDKEHRVEVNTGRRLVSKRLPLGWSKADYVEQQIGHEQFSWLADDAIVYSRNVKDVEGTFQYSKDLHKGIYSIFARNLTSGEEDLLVDAFPGGASRPILSRDKRTLAFVRRVRDKEALVLKDLQTGTIHHIWHGLTYDLSIIYAPMGTYPTFAFDTSDEAIIIWAAGQIYHVPLSTNSLGERVSGGTPQAIGFRAHIELKLAETVKAKTDVRELEKGEQRLHAFTQLALDESGQTAVFQAAGVTYTQIVGKADAERVPVAYPEAAYYSPSFVGGDDELVIHTRWSNTYFSSFEIADLYTGVAYEVTGVPMGRYLSPVVSGGEGAQRTIAFVKTGGDVLTGDIVATAHTGLWIGEITLPTDASSSSHRVAVTNARKIGTTIDPDDDAVKLAFISPSKLLVHQSDRAFSVDLSLGANEWGRYTEEKLASGYSTDELVFSHSTRGAAISNFRQVYYAPNVNPSMDLWSKPGKAPAGLARLSLDGGHDISMSGDGNVVGWFLGPYLHTIPIDRLSSCSQAIEEDTQNFGVGCVTSLLDVTEVYVHYESEVTRLRREAKAFAGADIVAFVNATILTMENGELDEDLISGGTVVLRDGLIEAVGKDTEVHVPTEALVIQAEGGYIVPGFIDAHAHWVGYGTKYPAISFEMETFLAYGVTTMHNPSSDNNLGFVERARVESGLMVGPRIFHTGLVVYGASSYSYHADIASSQEAKEVLTRIKAEGGPASWSYKNYNLPARASRQRLLSQARKMNMACVPEGGMNFDWDQTYIVDGMTTVEHNIPIPELYDDILTLYVESGTGATPTHIVDYGGPMGEQLLWANEDIPNDAKLRQFTRHDTLEGLSESTSRPANSMALFNVSASIAKMVHRGLHAHIGAHGEPPLGLMYHQEMAFTRAGGLSNYEVIRAATSDAASTFGLDTSLGSVTEGKLADLVIYPGGFDLLNDDIRQTRNIRFVTRSGRIWEADTMTEVWPVKGRKQVLPPFNAE
ncbi:hypothetical protein HYDPIDRAFT_113258 [Hydnomerulius pinastri MD-312]|uniref:Amidohydrolase-related domain-containing protein n=1 Tax=Hydnomerulius pinastri MD-312 TaxID=994086 RepID=A0A0C9VCF8_9AGAM|nr:hypothetical protein HYDPIDRAFT_113258 [Hydnomerulius pinastri MD-312]